MQRNLFALIVGSAMIGGAALASCSGGGSSPSPLAANGSTAPGSGNIIQSNGNGGLTFTLTISNSPSTSKKTVGRRRAVVARRAPQYIPGTSAQGLQIAVSGGGNAKTVYADISNGSPLCTAVTDGRTCTLTVPTVAATETITATELDQTPTSEGTNGYPAGYGGGFPTTSNILGAGTTTTPTNTGTASVTLGISPVLANVLDGCVEGIISSSSPTTTDYSAAIDFTNSPGMPVRLVVTSGVAQTMVNCFWWFDADNDYSAFVQSSSPLPFVDVNASPEPVTIGSSSQGVTVYALPSPVPSTNPSPTATTASMPNTSYIEYSECFYYTLRVDGTQTLNPITTVTISSNLSATMAPYVTGTPYPNHSGSFEIVPLTVSGVTGTVAVTGGTTGNVIGTDYQGTGGLLPYGSATNANGLQYSGECVDGSGTEHATVTSAGAISPTTWQQSFTIAPVLAGSCSFVLVDYNTWYAMTNNEWDTVPVITPAVSLTVGS